MLFGAADQHLDADDDYTKDVFDDGDSSTSEDLEHTSDSDGREDDDLDPTFLMP